MLFYGTPYCFVSINVPNAGEFYYEFHANGNIVLEYGLANR